MISKSALASGADFALLPGALSGCLSPETLVGFATQLGPLVPRYEKGPLVETLQVVEKTKAKPRSLSAMHGTASFPFHSDMAHWPVPCRYIVLACQNAGDDHRPTGVISWKDIPLSASTNADLKNGIFLVRNGRRSFYCNIQNPTHGFFRFDPGCMAPANIAAKRFVTAFEEASAEARRTTVNWKEGDVLLVDNWRALHARGAGEALGSERLLLRVLCQGSDN